MHIWLINHYAVPPKYYPLARQTYFAKNLMAMGHTVTIISASTIHNSNPTLNLITDGTLWKREQADGIDHVYINCCAYKGNGLSRIKNMYEFAWRLSDVCKHLEKPDAIVSTSMPPMSCAAGVKLARKYGVKAIAEIADLWPESIIAYDIAGPYNPAVLYLRKLEKWIYKNADAVVFTMAGAYDYIKEQNWEKEIPRSKVHYINNGIDLEQFDYNKEHFTVQDEDLENENIFKVVYTGSIRRVNNLGKLLDVAKLVTNPNVKFLIWGAGDEVPQLQERVAKERIINVVFKGRVEKKYVPYIVCKANLNIVHGISSVLSRYGTSNNKIFDYLAAGKPILHDFLIKYNPIIDYNAGVEVQSGKPEDIAAMVDKLASSSPDVLAGYGKNARAAAKEFDFKVLTERLIKLINDIVV